jgi:hypothetical protein
MLEDLQKARVAMQGHERMCEQKDRKAVHSGVRKLVFERRKAVCRML